MLETGYQISPQQRRPTFYLQRKDKVRTSVCCFGIYRCRLVFFVFLKLTTFLDLIKYCIRQNIPFTEFEDWSSISATVKDIVSGKVNLKDVAVSGAREARHGK
jgi:hypothetical protein